MANITLVDDDENIVASVSLALESHGHKITAYHDGAAGLEALEANPPDLAILDVKMPRMDGMELLSRLRRTSDVPTIFLTSKDDEIDEVLGLKMGADDYIRKPFSQRLLIERVRTILRRTEARNDRSPAAGEAKTIVRGPLVLDPARHTCTWRNMALSLTVTEFLILQALATRPGLVKSRDQLMDAAYEDQVYVDDRTIDSHIKRLRRKFREFDAEFDAIETLYGLGYRYKEK